MSDSNWEPVGRFKVADWWNRRWVSVNGNQVRLTVNNCGDRCEICLRRMNTVTSRLSGQKHHWEGHTKVVISGYDGNMPPEVFLTKALGLPVSSEA